MMLKNGKVNSAQEKQRFLALLKKLPRNRLWGPSSSEVGFTFEVGKRHGSENVRGKRIWRGRWSLAAWCDWDIQEGNSTLISSRERRRYKFHVEFENKINAFLKNQIIWSVDFDDANGNISVLTSGGFKLRFLPKRADDWTLFVNGNSKMRARTWFSIGRRSIVEKD
jgi:hypothetical protein